MNRSIARFTAAALVLAVSSFACPKPPPPQPCAATVTVSRITGDGVSHTLTTATLRLDRKDEKDASLKVEAADLKLAIALAPGDAADTHVVRLRMQTGIVGAKCDRVTPTITLPEGRVGSATVGSIMIDVGVSAAS